MPISSKYMYVVSMDVDPNKEALFNEVYDTEHVPNLLKVPGVRAVTRMAGEPFAVSIAGAEKKVAHDGPRYSAVYEIDGPQVLISPAWAKAVEEGRRRCRRDWMRFGRSCIACASGRGRWPIVAGSGSFPMSFRARRRGLHKDEFVVIL